jgi:hypothetical protein
MSAVSDPRIRRDRESRFTPQALAEQ